jgi:hypothetical protein
VTGAQIFRGVAGLLAQPGTWTQHAWARDAEGNGYVRPLGPEAVCWCIRGAVRKVAGTGCTKAEDEAIAALYVILRRGDGCCREITLAAWNDAPARRVDDVIRLVARAAEYLEAKQ